MPYANDVAGIYKIVNRVNGLCYVGQSARVRKRIQEHFRLLRMNRHPNPKLQNAFNKYGEEQFEWAIEVVCADIGDLDSIENAFLAGDARFTESTFYNIANAAKVVMRNRKHTDETKAKMREAARKSKFDRGSAEYRAALSKGQEARHFSNPEFVRKVKFIVENPDMSYAERARRVGNDITTVRRLALRYKHLRGEL
jgi:group I intron endonuclease